MSNWYYNEVEMLNKHKMLSRAGAKNRRSKLAQNVGRSNLVHQGFVFLGRHLVDAGRGLLNRYEPASGPEVVAQSTGSD